VLEAEGGAGGEGEGELEMMFADLRVWPRVGSSHPQPCETDLTLSLPSTRAALNVLVQSNFDARSLALNANQGL